MVNSTSIHSSYDRTKEWYACCHEIFMGRNPKRQRADSQYSFDDGEADHNDENDVLITSFAAPGCLAINLCEKRCEQTGKSGDSWMKAAQAMSSSIDEVAHMIRSRSASYVSSSDTLNICFQRDTESTENEMSNADRSILETTVASFAASMAKQIDSLRQTIATERDHPHLSSEHHDEPTQQWASGPMGHRAGIAACLMQRLKLEIMEPMTRLTMEREGKFKNAEDACQIAQNPLLGFCSTDRDRQSVPPAQWEIGDHDNEQDEMEREQEREDFMSIYGHENVQKKLSDSFDVMKSNLMPPTSVMKLLDIPTPKYASEEHVQPNNPAMVQKPQQKTQPTVSSHMPHKSPIRNNLYNEYNVTQNEEEKEVEQLQRESAALLATYEHSDLEGVQKVERSMVEITQLLSRFTDLISEQQEDIFMIHDQAVKSKHNVDKGQDQLVDAAKRGEKNRHPMATFIVCMALILLFLNWILP